VRLQSGFIRAHHGKLLFLLRTMDALVIGASLMAACWLTERTLDAKYTIVAVLGILFFHVFRNATGVDLPGRVRPMAQQTTRLLANWVLTVVALLTVGFLAKASHDYSRVTILAWFALGTAGLLAWRVGMRLLLQEARMRGRNTRTVAICGATEAGMRMAQHIEESPWYGLDLVGFYDDRYGPGETHHIGSTERPDLQDASERVTEVPSRFGGMRGDFESLIADARAGKVDTVYVAIPLRGEGRIREVIARLADTTVTVHVIADLLLSDLLQSGWSTVGPIPVLSVYDTPFRGINSWLKRMEDIVLGAIILGIISIPMAVIALAIKLTSKGPIFFQQTRYGLNGQPIRVLKFRTMSVAEDGDHVKQAQRGDSRITKLGALLRRTSLDELPQFINVLSGEMSIVGPRPHAVAHNEEYRGLIPGYMLRHKVKPGITGWAQVNGWRGETDTIGKMEKRIEHDLAYIRRWDLWLDLKIIFLTVFGRQTWQNAY